MPCGISCIRSIPRRRFPELNGLEDVGMSRVASRWSHQAPSFLQPLVRVLGLEAAGMKARNRYLEVVLRLPLKQKRCILLKQYFKNVKIQSQLVGQKGPEDIFVVTYVITVSSPNFRSFPDKLYSGEIIFNNSFSHKLLGLDG